MTQVDHGAGEAPSDAELILQVRSGDREAFGTLYTRHAAAARALARQYVKPGDAEDVVADAFSKLYEMLRRGAGPDSGFRTYLYTVVRHRAYDVSRGASRTRPVEDAEIEAALGRVASSEDPALQGFERSVVSRAYFGLPERWREVLWYCLVDDLKPAQVAPVLGLTPNGVSALLYRAKDALRDGYLQQHLTHAPSDTCRAVNPHLGGYVRDSLSRREKARIEAHLSTCGTCSALVLELADVAHGMKCVVAPLVLGAAGLALVGSAIPVGTSLAAAVKAASASGFAGASAGGAAGGGVGSASAGSGMGVGASSTGGGTTAGVGAGTTAGVGAGTTAGAGATAGAGTAGAGTTATVGSTAGAAASAGASAAGTAAGVAGATAGATAVGVVGAGGAAAAGGGALAGAITVATVGVVTALQIVGSQADAGPEAPPVVASSPDTSPASSPGPSASPEPSAPPESDPADPANLLPLAEDVTLSFADGDTPLQPRQAQDIVLTVNNRGAADITGATVRLTLPDGMTPAAQDSPSGAGVGATLAAVVSPTAGPGSGGGHAAPDAPAGGADAPGPGGDGTGAKPGSGASSGSGVNPGSGAASGSAANSGTGTNSGTGASSGTDTGETTAAGAEADGATPAPSESAVTPVPTLCTPASEPGVVSCDVGVLGAGETREVQVTVRARAGGSYAIGAELRADDIESTPVALPSRTVELFGPELTAQAEAAALASPGRGVLALRVGNTGDVRAASGWSVVVTLPDGVRPAATQEALVCTPLESRTWSCAAGEPTEMEPGAWRELPLAVVALPTATASVAQAEGTATVTPSGPPHAQAARALVTVTSAWTGAGNGAGALAAKCVRSGGLADAKAEVVGTYTNTTARNVSVALDAAGGTASHVEQVAPGESVTLRRDGGIRVLGAPATWVLTRVVEGTAYEHRVAAGELTATDCYDPTWDTTTSAATVNAGGTVGVRGTLGNTSDEPMNVKMVVEGRGGRLVSESRNVAPGGRETFTVTTKDKRVPAGTVTFHLARWTFDKDGDPPAGPAQPGSWPRAAYGRAAIAPSYGAGQQTMSSECTYDAERGASMATFRVSVDNTASTLPVGFRFGNATRTLAAGETGTLETQVPWGTGKLPMLAGGDTLGQIDVAFASCARVDWPEESVEVEVEAQCVDGDGQVVADVRNSGGVAWRGALVRSHTGQRGEEADVPADGAVRLVLPGPGAPVHDSVTVRLSREFEGAVHTVERRHDVPPVTCEPPATCQNAEPTSWFTAWFGRRCPEENGNQRDERVQQATFTTHSFWGRGHGA